MVALNARCLAILCVVWPSAALHAQPHLALEAPLNEAGYQRVALLKNDGDMKTFIKRILAKLGYDVTDEGQLSGFSSYYSGTQAVQQYDKLEKELQVVPWVQKHPAKAQPVKAVEAKAALAKTHAKKAHAAGSNSKTAAAVATTSGANSKKMAAAVATTTGANRNMAATTTSGANSKMAVAATGARRKMAATTTTTTSGANGKMAAAVATTTSGANRKMAAATTTAGANSKMDAPALTTAAATKASAIPAKSSTAPVPHQAMEASTDTVKGVAEGSLADVTAATRVNFMGQGVHKNDVSAAEANALPTENDTHLLPAVNEVLSSASKNLEVFSANADQMRKKADQMQQAAKRNLTLLKAHYVTRLNTWKADNEELVAKSEVLRSNISRVNATNDALETQANNLQDSIDVLHETFAELVKRVDVAEGFIGDSLNSTEVDDAPEVQVLAPTTPKPTLASFLLDARLGLGLGSTSFPPTASPENLDASLALLQVAAGRTVSVFDGDENAPNDPAKMTSFLLRTLEKLGEAEMAATQQLKDHFAKARAKWTERNGELSAENSRLKSQLVAVTQRRTDLEAVTASMTDTNSHLKKKLAEFSDFLNFLDKVVNNAVIMASNQTVPP